MDESNTYLHMDREDMENDIEAGGFLEHGLHEEHLYGTKFDSVRQVIQSSKMCVLDIEATVRKRILLIISKCNFRLGVEIDL